MYDSYVMKKMEEERHQIFLVLSKVLRERGRNFCVSFFVSLSGNPNISPLTVLVRLKGLV